MIKDDEVAKARRKAETSGEAHDIWAYAEALEARVAHPHSALLYDPADNERTRATATAHVEALGLLRRTPLAATGPVQMIATAEATYVLEVHGQPSAAANGRQGLRPGRLELLDRIEKAGIPVLLAFRDGETWELAWLSELGEAEAISHGDGTRESKRYGWKAKEFDRYRDDEEALERFPVDHRPKPLAQTSLA